MSKPRPPAFDPADVAESNATGYPAKFREANSTRWNRRLGNHAGLSNPTGRTILGATCAFQAG